jgi:hypothetical protein
MKWWCLEFVLPSLKVVFSKMPFFSLSNFIKCRIKIFWFELLFLKNQYRNSPQFFCSQAPKATRRTIQVNAFKKLSCITSSNEGLYDLMRHYTWLFCIGCKSWSFFLISCFCEQNQFFRYYVDLHSNSC